MPKATNVRRLSDSQSDLCKSGKGDTRIGKEQSRAKKEPNKSSDFSHSLSLDASGGRVFLD